MNCVGTWSGGQVLAVAHHSKGMANFGSPNAEFTDLGGQCCTLNPLEAVEVGDALRSQAFLGAELDLRWD